MLDTHSKFFLILGSFRTVDNIIVKNDKQLKLYA